MSAAEVTEEIKKKFNRSHGTQHSLCSEEKKLTHTHIDIDIV